MDKFLWWFTACCAVGFSRSCGCACCSGMLASLPHLAWCTFSSTSVGCAAHGTGHDSLCGVAGTPLPFWFSTLLVAKVSQWGLLLWWLSCWCSQARPLEDLVFTWCLCARDVVLLSTPWLAFTYCSLVVAASGGVPCPCGRGFNSTTTPTFNSPSGH